MPETISRPAITDERKAYIAALIDNFGNISIRKTSAGAVQPAIFMSGKRPIALQMMADLTETKVVSTTRSGNRHRCSEHCTEAHDERVSSSFRWQVTGLKATIMLYNIRPFMMVREDEARSTYLAGIDAPFKGAGLDTMARLGWEIPSDLLDR